MVKPKDSCLLDAYATLRKAIVGFVMSVRPSVRTEQSVLTGRIFMKFEYESIIDKHQHMHFFTFNTVLV